MGHGLRLIVLKVMAGIGDPGELRGITNFKPEYALGGIAGAAIVFVSIVTVRELGAGGVASSAASPRSGPGSRTSARCTSSRTP